MKNTNIAYIVCTLLVVACCFVPWVYIPSINSNVTGMNAAVVNYGRPGIMQIVFSSLSLMLFLLPSIWAKRINVFVCAFNFSWAIRNYLVVTQCEMGECPEKKWGIFAILLLTLTMLIFSFFPQMKQVETSVANT